MIESSLSSSRWWLVWANCPPAAAPHRRTPQETIGDPAIVQVHVSTYAVLSLIIEKIGRAFSCSITPSSRPRSLRHCWLWPPLPPADAIFIRRQLFFSKWCILLVFVQPGISTVSLTSSAVLSVVQRWICRAAHQGFQSPPAPFFLQLTADFLYRFQPGLAEEFNEVTGP